MQIIEIKIKENTGILWENIPVLCEIQASALQKTVQRILENFQFIEMRWNYKGLLQGHYIKGNVSRWSGKYL